MSRQHPFKSASRKLGTSVRRFLFSATWIVVALLAIPVLVAQPPSQPDVNPGSVPAKRSIHPNAKPSPAHALAQQEQPAQAAPAPDPPHWPADDPPGKPSVTWDSRGLRIDATNASLRDILNDVSTATGAKVEGLGADERVFGQYGPGQARDVLSQLLHGSEYNVLLIGDQGQGTPREIVLSPRRPAASSQALNRATPDTTEDDTPEQPETEDQPVQPPPLINGRPPVPPPQGPPGAPRTPQQVLQELQQRQQQLQEQQQQQQQQPQPQPH